MHEGAYRFVARVALELGPRASIVELGSRTVAGPWPYSGPVRPLFPGSRYLGIDTVAGDNVDVVADAATWRPEPGEAVDTVLCTETLEHAPQAEEICRNAWCILPVGGVLVLTAAGVGRAPHSAVDGGELRPGEFYRNVGRDDLQRWLAPFGFSMIDAFSVPGDIYALAVKVAATP